MESRALKIRAIAKLLRAHREHVGHVERTGFVSVEEMERRDAEAMLTLCAGFPVCTPWEVRS